MHVHVYMFTFITITQKPAARRPPQTGPLARSRVAGCARRSCAMRGALSSLWPALMSMIADLTRPEQRILAYGLIALGAPWHAPGPPLERLGPLLV